MLFLALFAAVVLLKVFPRIYVELASRAPAAILGQLMWIRLCILAVLSIRTMGGIDFGFLPTRKDWKIGIQQFLLFAPVAIVIGMAIGFARPHLAFTIWWKGALLVVSTFAGFLWVVGLMEEFFVRGMLQQLLTRRFKSTIAGLIVASIIFGLAHLPFRQFPNWRFAIMASHRRCVLRPRLHTRGQRACGHGDACTGRNHVEGLLCLIPDGGSPASSRWSSFIFVIVYLIPTPRRRQSRGLAAYRTLPRHHRRTRSSSRSPAARSC